MYVACVVGVSVRFRSKERGTRVKDRAKNGSRSSVFLCPETKRTRLLHKLRCMSHGGCSEQKSNVYFLYRYRFVLKEISIQ